MNHACNGLRAPQSERGWSVHTLAPQDARKRNAVVLYATHIFDGLEEWLDSVAFISRGKLQFKKKQAEMPEIKEHGLLATVSGCVSLL